MKAALFFQEHLSFPEIIFTELGDKTQTTGSTWLGDLLCGKPK